MDSKTFKMLSIFLFLLLLLTTQTLCDGQDDLYTKFCNDFVPSAETTDAVDASRSQNLSFRGGFYIGGQPVFNTSSPYHGASLSVLTVRKTHKNDVFFVSANLRFGKQSFTNRPVRRDHPFRRVRSPRLIPRAAVSAEGFLSESSYRLCLIGSSANRYTNTSILIKLQYPRNPSLDNFFVNGTVEGSGFERISVIGMYAGDYKYTRVLEDRNLSDPRGMPTHDGICSRRWLFWLLRNPMSVIWNGTNTLGEKLAPQVMSIEDMKCDPGGRVRGVFALDGYTRDSLPGFVGEGFLSGGNRQLSMVGCYFDRRGEFLDCSVKFSMEFVSSWTIRERSVIVGRVESALKMSKFSFRGPVNDEVVRAFTGVKYRYTMLDQVRVMCNDTFSEKRHGNTQYPDEFTPADLGFHFVAGYRSWKTHGFADLLAIGDEIQSGVLFSVSWNRNHSARDVSPRLLNVSYVFSLSLDKSSAQTISAEGLYDPLTGLLCMVGCRRVENYMDCEIQINVKFAPLNQDRVSTKHTIANIQSLRSPNDSYYFKPERLSSFSMYYKDAVKNVKREILEIVMALVSPTLAAIFISCQLFYVKKHSDSLPTVSLLMLTLLSLSYMLPLVLNFEALFATPRKQNVLQLGGGWFQLDEILVRIITMAAFLLEIRLLQLVWSARSSTVEHKSPWSVEEQVIKICLPIYIIGAVVACILHWFGISHSHGLQRSGGHSLWQDFKAFGGIIIDGFLLPQILGNFFWDINGTILVPYFYIGMTLVRSLPHAYDVYRGFRLAPRFNTIYFYADPEWDLYSTAWDIAILSGGFLLAFVVFFQQKCGGRCIVPNRFRPWVAYDRVSILEEAAQQQVSPVQE